MKKFITVLLTFTLYFNLISNANAASNVGGWSMGSPVAQGASAVYTGTKNVIINGADYIKKGTAKITPPASSVAKVLARGVAGYALSVAVEQLLGSVDWVLDPANNQIRYKENADPEGRSPECTMIAALGNVPQYITSNGYSTYKCSASWTKVNQGKTETCVVITGIKPNGKQDSFGQYCKVISVPEQEEKTKPLTDIAAQVISNAEGGDTNAQVATMAAAADIVDEASKDDAKARPIAQQLESTAKTTPADEAAAEKANEATGEAKPNTVNPEATDLSIEFPIFCNWAPSVCEAAQVVISFPQTLSDWWNTAKSKAEEWATAISEAWTKVKEEYADKPEENTDTELDIPDLSDETIDTDISFNGYCPAPLSSDINFMGLNKTIEFSFDPVCQIAEFIKPVVISISAFSAALIVAGIRTEDD